MEPDSAFHVPNVSRMLMIVAFPYILYYVSIIIYNVFFHPLAQFSGPISRTGVHAGDYWHFFNGSQPHSVKKLHDKYGDVVRIRPNSLTFNTASAWKDIYGSHPGKGQLQKDPGFYTIGGKPNPSILYSNDADHSRMRKLLSHAFSDAALRQQEDIMNQYFDLLVQKLKEQIDGPTNGEVDLTRWYNFLTFDVIGDLCFAESFNALQSGEYHVWMKNVFQRIKFGRFYVIAAFYEPLLTILKLVLKLKPSISKASDEHKQFTYLKTAKRLDAKTDRKDFMSYILRYNDERGMSRQELLGTSNILIVGGSETTATLLSGLTYYLLKTPRVYAKLMEEVRGAFQQADEITLTSTSRLSYLHACIEEGLRLYPPGPIAFPRLTRPEGDIIGGVFVPGKTTVGVAQFAAYHSAKNFHEPETFVPERWLPNPPEKYRNDIREVCNPFSTGPRNCIGKNLAYNEMRSVMARMIWHFDMQLCDESERWEDQYCYFLWDKPPLNIRLFHRKFD